MPPAMVSRIPWIPWILIPWILDQEVSSAFLAAVPDAGCVYERRLGLGRSAQKPEMGKLRPQTP